MNSDTPQDDSSITMPLVFHIVRVGWKKIVSSLIIGTAMGFLMAYLLSPGYRVTTSLLAVPGTVSGSSPVSKLNLVLDRIWQKPEGGNRVVQNMAIDILKDPGLSTRLNSTLGEDKQNWTSNLKAMIHIHAPKKYQYLGSTEFLEKDKLEIIVKHEDESVARKLSDIFTTHLLELLKEHNASVELAFAHLITSTRISPPSELMAIHLSSQPILAELYEVKRKVAIIEPSSNQNKVDRAPSLDRFDFGQSEVQAITKLLVQNKSKFSSDVFGNIGLQLASISARLDMLAIRKFTIESSIASEYSDSIDYTLVKLPEFSLSTIKSSAVRILKAGEFAFLGALLGCLFSFLFVVMRFDRTKL